MGTNLKRTSIAVSIALAAMQAGAALATESGIAPAGCSSGLTCFDLMGDYVRVGMSSRGTLGSGSGTHPGILFNAGGLAGSWDDASGTPPTGVTNINYDYLTPGSPFWGFTVLANGSSQVNNNTGAQAFSVASFTNESDSTKRQAVWLGNYAVSGSSSYSYSVKQDISFNKTDKFVTFKTTIKNTGAAAISGIKFATYTDPDYRAGGDGSHDTKNINGTLATTAIGLPDSSAGNIVLSYSTDGIPGIMGFFTQSSVTHGAGVSEGWTTDPNHYLSNVGDDVGNTPNDYAIGLGFDVGSLAPGAESTLVYNLIFGQELSGLLQFLQDSGLLTGGYCETLRGTTYYAICSSLGSSGAIGGLSPSTPGFDSRLRTAVTPRARDIAATAVGAGRAGTSKIIARMDAVRGGKDDGKGGGKGGGKRGAVGVPIFADGGLLFDGAALAASEESYGGGAGSTDGESTGVFLRGAYSKARYKDSAAGFRSDGFTIVAGADRYLTEQLLAGVALSYSVSDSDDTGRSGGVKLAGGGKQTMTTLSAFGSYEVRPKLYLEGVAGYSQVKVDTKRDTTADFAHSKTDGYQFNLSAGVRTERELSADWTAKPFVWAHYADTRIDGYTERGSGIANLTVGGLRSESLVSEVGSAFVRDLRDGLQLELRAAWEHNFRHQLPTSHSRLAGTATDWVRSEGASGKRDYGRLGAALVSNLASNQTLTLHLDTMVLNPDYDEHSVELMYRMVF